MSGRRTQPADKQVPSATAVEVREAVKANEAIPGGKYKTADGRWVNAEGQEITASGKVKDD